MKAVRADRIIQGSRKRRSARRSRWAEIQLKINLATLSVFSLCAGMPHFSKSKNDRDIRRSVTGQENSKAMMIISIMDTICILLASWGGSFPTSPVLELLYFIHV